MEEESRVEIVELFSHPNSPSAESVSNAASSLLDLWNASSTASAPTASVEPTALVVSNEPTALVIVVYQEEQFESAPAHPPSVPIRLGWCTPVVIHDPALPLTPNSPFYHSAGYLVTQTLVTSARLKTIAPVDRHIHHTGTRARLSEVTQYDGVPLQMPLNSVLEQGDILLLLSVIPVHGSSPLVMQFEIHQSMEFRLHLIVLLDYADGLLQYFSKPQAPETGPVSESLSISLAPMANYCFRVTIFHESLMNGTWIFCQFQLTLLMASVVIQINAYVGHAGFVCLGPEDPYANTPYYADALQYWLPVHLLGNANHFHRLMMLNVRVSQCPAWAFST